MAEDNAELLKKAVALEDEAIALKGDGKLKEAVEKLNEAIAAYPEFGRAHLALATYYFELGDAEKMVSHAEQAAMLDSKDPFTFTALSVSYQRAFELTRDESFIMKAEDAMARSRMM